MSTLTKKDRWLEIATDKFGKLDREDSRDSARIFLQGRLNAYRADYAVGHAWATIEAVRELESAIQSV